MKRCPRCNQTKPLEDFPVTNRTGPRTGRRHSFCRPCLTQVNKEWNASHPEGRRAHKKKWETANRDKVLAQKKRSWDRSGRDTHKRWAKENPARLAQYGHENYVRRKANGKDALSRYGVPQEKLEQLLATQNNACIICKKDLSAALSNGRRAWSVDHDHSCCQNVQNTSCPKCIRGILCNMCNLRLGWYEAHQEGLTAYLESPRPFL